MRILVLILLSVSAVFAQKKEYVSVKDAITSGSILAGKRGPQSVNWIHGGKAFSYIDGPGTIKTFDPATGKEEVAFEVSGLKFPGSNENFEYESFQWSADFRYLVFQANFRPVWRHSGDADYYLYSLENKSLKLVAKDARTAELSPDGKKVAYERDGNLFVLELASGKEKQLTRDASESVYNGRFGWVYEEEFGLVQAWSWSPDSRYIAFWKSDESKVPVYQMSDFQGLHSEFEKIPYPRVGDPNVDVKVGIMDLKEEAPVKWADIALNDGYIPRIYWTARPGILAVQHLNRSQNHLTLYFFEAQSGKSRKIFEEKDEKGWVDVYDFFAFSNHFMMFPSSKEEFYWISGRDGFQHIYRYDYAGKLLNQVTSGSWDVSNIAGVNEKEGSILYVSTEKSPLERQLYSVSADGKSKKRLTAGEGKHTVDVSVNGQYFIDTYSNSETPFQVGLYSSAGKQIKVFEENRGVLDFVSTHYYARRELMSFKASDGQSIDIFVTKPRDFDPSVKYPVVFSIYGGPGSQSVYNQWNSGAWEQWLAQNGYVVASVNNRGSSGYGQKFMKSVYRRLGAAEAADFVETAAFLKKFPWVDGERMAIQGHSYGGYMSTYTMLRHPDVFKVAIIGAPVTDWRLYDNVYTERYMGLLPENEAGYRESVLPDFAGNLKGKVLLAHSTMDDNVHILNTFRMVKAFTDHGIDIDLRIYPPGNHAVAYSFESYVLLYQTYFNYLEKHLKGKP